MVQFFYIKGWIYGISKNHTEQNGFSVKMERFTERVTLEDFGITESYIIKQQENRFGNLKDIFTETSPAPVTSIQDYFDLHGLSIKKLKLMAYDLDYAVGYLNEHASKIEIELYGKSNANVEVLDTEHITIYPSKEVLTEHINLIYTNGDDLPYIWYEPHHIRNENVDYFGFEDEEDWKLKKRFRPKMFAPTSQTQVDEILNTFDNL
jgi:hypothetical protein